MRDGATIVGLPHASGSWMQLMGWTSQEVIMYFVQQNDLWKLRTFSSKF